MNSFAFMIHLVVVISGSLITIHSARNISSEFLSTILFGGFTLIYGVAPLFLDSTQESTTSLLVAGACLASLIGLYLGRRLARETIGLPAPLDLTTLFGNKVRRILVLSFMVGVFGVAAFAYGAAGSIPAYMASGRFEFRLNPANSTLYLLGLYLLSFIGVPSLMLAWQRRTRLLGLLFGLATALFAFYFLKGTRSLAIGVIIGAIILTSIGMERSALRQGRSKNSTRSLGVMLLAGIFMMMFLPNMYAARHQLSSGEINPTEVLFGPQDQASSGPIEGSRSGVGSIFEQEPLNYAGFLNSATSIYPQQNDFLWAYPLRRVIFFPLPSGGIKPPDTNKVFAENIGKAGNSTTIPPSLPGEGYVVLGGVAGAGLWSLLYGFGLGWLEARLRRPTVARDCCTNR